MKNASIIVPASNFLIRSDWSIEATNKNQVAAELLESIFLAHHDNHYANRLLVELTERAKAKETKYYSSLDWLPYSMSYLEELLLFSHKRADIIDAIDELKEIKFISTDVPTEISDYYSKSHLWVEVQVKNIQIWLNRIWIPLRNGTKRNELPEYYLKGEIQSSEIKLPKAKPPQQTIKKSIQPKATKANESQVRPQKKTKWQIMEENVNIVCAFYKHIQGFNNNYVFDKERKGYVRARLKEGRTLAQCAQATLSNVISDFYQGRSDMNRIGVPDKKGRPGRLLNDIKYPFQKASSFEHHLWMAESAIPPITIFDAKRELEAFLAGHPSKYAKKVIKPVPIGSDASKSLSEEAYEDRNKYYSFASSIASFFKTLDNPSIFEMCESNRSLLKLGKGLTVSRYLIESLIKFEPDVSEEVKEKMKSFADKFCEYQELNKEKE